MNQEIEDLQPQLRAYAYNITGSYEDASDIVQDVLLKQWQQSDKELEHPKAYLIRMVINHAINFKNRQQRLVRDYVGPWLPEPVATERADHSIQQEEILNYSLLVLMERLNPKERAVLILKEAFHYSHEEIAEMLDINAALSRQLLSRSRKTLKDRKELTKKSDPSDTLIQDYMDAISKGETEKLTRMLKEDICITSDGGGKASASTKPVTGRQSVIKFLLGLYKKYNQGLEVRPATINHQKALLHYARHGDALHGDAGYHLIGCQIFEVREGSIQNIYFMRNPDKLAFLAKVS